ncbi:EthD domain-containing protein [Sphingopyxis sp. GC21]|uniref:EthD domain-containing protein n=1 Tax=Sphingopyxis sp. GC21 TaxID=2933562 RepID=UPI0021E4218D|nr:EthD domain-containing protein [Sphingopyxis sp. GC21]
MRPANAYKVALFLTRNPECTAAEFTEAWIGGGNPGPAPGLGTHVYNAPGLSAVPIENAPPAPFDGVDEYSFDSAASAAMFFASDRFAADWIAPRAQLLAAPILAISGPAHVLWDRAGPPPANPVKILTLPVRRAGMSQADFGDYWIHSHFSLAIGGPGTSERLRQAVTCPADGCVLVPFGAAPFDGIGTIVFDNMADLEAEFSSAHYRDRLAPDEPKFTDPAKSRAMMVRETILFSNA